MSNQVMTAAATPARAEKTVQRRVVTADWDRVAADLDAQGFAVVPALLGAKDCRMVSSLYPDDARFRSHIVMARHGFGRGEYKYFAYPLARSRSQRCGPRSIRILSHIANRWNESMGIDVRYPAEHEAFLRRCHDAGQTRPTPLLLQYGAGDFNCLHQDLYGEHVFPLQVAVLLSEPDDDFTGGEFVLTEQRPRMQSRAAVVPLRHGDAVVFCRPSPPGSGHEGHLSRQSSPRRQHGADGPAAHAWHHLPRRQMRACGSRLSGKPARSAGRHGWPGC